MVINEAAFFYPSDLVCTKATIDASRLGIYPPLFTSPSGDSCILLNSQPRIMHFTYTDWFAQSWLSAHIPLFDLIW